MGKVTRLFCWHKDFVHKGLSAPAPGLYTCGKTLKMCIKSEFKEICLKLATNVIGAFCWHQKIVPKGFSALALGLYTCIKSLKMCIKSDLKRSFWNLQHMGKEKKPFCCHQNSVPNGLSVPARGYIYNWAASWQNQQNGMCAERRLISLGIHTVWSESSLCSQWVAKDPSFLQTDSEVSDQTGWMPRPIWLFTGCTCHFVGFVMRWLIWWNMKKMYCI